MIGAKSVSIPFASHFKLFADMSQKSDEEMEQMSSVPYSSDVGCIMYAMICTHPDILHAISVVSRYMACPGRQAVKWILRYLKGTTDVGLTFYKDKLNESLVGYVDSDYAGDLDKRRSLTGYVFTLSGSVISWKETLQSVVALSTAEAKYIVITEAVKEPIWLQVLYMALKKKARTVQRANAALGVAVDSLLDDAGEYLRVEDIPPTTTLPDSTTPEQTTPVPTSIEGASN
ncbi:secreted RxLR effector protein 161-like [Nicotiana sylvestris]|uniref:secreted RxLR effector protein 161-like n=1 Tax=Nicotiana sylvestris TaxID=4096 RepID=UPI00388C8A5D